MRTFEKINKKVVYNFYGKINNFYQAPVAYHAPVTNTLDDNIQPPTYSDEHIARAIEAVCGENKPVDAKRKWAAVYWCLRWYCNFPVRGSEFCERINRLPFSRPLTPECEYENFRKLLTLSVMNQDARQLDAVRPDKCDEDMYNLYRPIVLALANELMKQQKNMKMM